MSRTNLGPTETILARLLNKRLRSVIPPIDLTPVQVAVIYALFGFSALYFSDVYLPQTIGNQETLAQIQALKGGVEVVVTAGLIFLLTRRSRKTLDKRNEQLNALQAERSILYRVFRHNLRQDINLVMGYSDSIRSNTDDETIVEECEKVVDRAESIGRYQNYMSRIERILEPPISLQTIDLADVVAESTVVADLEAREDVSLTTAVPEETLVVATPDVTEGFHEILKNAVKHNDSEEPEVEVTAESVSDEMVGLVVADNGPGISEYERQAIDQEAEQQLSHSSGMGLWQAKLACSVSGGDLDISDRAEGGSKVVLQLPRRYRRPISGRVSNLLG